MRGDFGKLKGVGILEEDETVKENRDGISSELRKKDIKQKRVGNKRYREWKDQRENKLINIIINLILCYTIIPFNYFSKVI